MRVRIGRVSLVALTALASVNVWTGAPLLAVWVGSRVERLGGHSGAGESMGAIVAIVLVLIVLELALTFSLGRLSHAYDELTGRPPEARRTSPWMRSMRGERASVARRRAGISGIERVVVLSVVLAVAAFEFWFFFLAGSSLPTA